MALQTFIGPEIRKRLDMRRMVQRTIDTMGGRLLRHHHPLKQSDQLSWERIVINVA